MIKSVLVLFLISLSACGGTISEINVTTKPVEITLAETADPNGVTMLPVYFNVINKDNLQEFLLKLKTLQGGDNPVFFAISTRDYENLILNFSDLRRYIEQQQAIILYYRQVTSHMAPKKPTTP